MIEQLTGIILKKEGGHVVLDVNGVGYGCEVPLSSTAVLPAPGERASLFTYLYVQEQVLRLYGFVTEEERSVFEVFLGLSGIGPKTALAILSSIDIASFSAAILRGDLITLTKLPGIGKKTAERLILELRDKVALFSDATVSTPVSRGTPGAPAALVDTIEALEALGCKRPVAERAAQKAWELLGPGVPVEELLKEALKHRR